MKTLKMSVSQWIAVPPNPIQRDTERHAARAKHLLTVKDVHSTVAAAQLPDGSYIKLDGHTRAFLWKTNQVRHPTHVDVNVYEVRNIEEARELYQTFDAREALETVNEKVSGAFSAVTFVPLSGLLVRGNITTALRLCWATQHGLGMGSKRLEDQTGFNVYKAVEEFTTEIVALDSYGLGMGAVPGGIIAAFILTYRKHGPDMLPFWRGVFSGTGEKRSGEMDAVQSLCELLLVRRGKLIGGGGRSAIYDLCCRAVTAAEKYLQDEMLTTIPRPYNLEGYINHARPHVTLIRKAAAK